MIVTMICVRTFDWNSALLRLLETFSSNQKENKVNVKVKLTLEQATKNQRWRRCIAPLFL